MNQQRKILQLVTFLCSCWAVQAIGQVHESREWVDKHVKLNQIQVLGSHNSYKETITPALLNVIRATNPQLARSLDYSHVSLTEQLEQGLRNLELDVFYDPNGGRYARPLGIFGLDGIGLPAGQTYDPEGRMQQPGFKVLHVQDIDFRSSCLTLKQGLEEMKAWSNSHRSHVPIVITLNAKDTVIDMPGFTHPIPFDKQAFDELDREFLDVFPSDRIIKPDDVRGEHATLEQAILDHHWPTLEKCRGKVLFVLDQSDQKLETYVSGHPSLRGRIMFVNAREGRPEAAFRIVNDPIRDAETIRRLVWQGYLVRTRADAGTEEARQGDTRRKEAAFASGAHFVSTDYYRPDYRFGTGYEVQLPGSGVTRWNPLFKNRPDFVLSE